jgi:glutathione S-transferase
MSDEIQFYHNPMSRGRIAHWMLEEVGVPYRIHLLRFDKGEHKAPAYLEVNPMGKIPAIVHKGHVVTEAAAICAYLADAFPEKGLAPKLDDPARGTYFRWLFFGAGCIEPALVDRMTDRAPVERKSALGYGSYEDTFKALEHALKPGPFILRDTFSAADVYIGSELGWGTMTKSIEPNPVFGEYMARISARPAFQRVVVQSNELAAQLKSEG